MFKLLARQPSVRHKPNWLKESKQEAEDCRISRHSGFDSVKVATSSCLYSLSTSDFSTQRHIDQAQNKFGWLKLSEFPYARIIRGDGGCYINCALVAILGRCIADKERWQIFKKNVARISSKANEIISKIEAQALDNVRGGLDFLKLNEIFTEISDQNLVTLLAKEILVPLHSNIILKYQKKLLEELSTPPFPQAKKANIERCRNYIKHISEAGKDFATSYEEAMVEDFVKQISWGMSTSSERNYLHIETLSEARFISVDEIGMPVISGLDDDPSIIYLFNSSGGAHFNLWYKKEDPICCEIEYQKKLATASASTSQPSAPPTPRTLPLLNPPETRQDQYFFSYRSQNYIVEFSTMSICNQNGKFNYKKWLTTEECNQYDPKAYNAEEEQKKIITMLKEAKAQTMRMFSGTLLHSNFFVAVMKVASKNSGIGNISSQKFEQDFAEACRKDFDRRSIHLNGSELHQIAKYFSATFQKLSGKEGYLTGRPGRDGSLNKTPRRLFRVCTEENIDMFKKELEMGLSSFRSLQSRSGPSRGGR